MAMKFTSQYLTNQLARLAAGIAAHRYVVAFSGGLDSTVLLHALVNGETDGRKNILAVHVDHGLHDAAAQWRRHCQGIADELGVVCETRSVEVSLRSGCGPEAAAREARYAVLRELVRPGDCVLSAHHREDQAETVLLNLLRGSGPAGVAAIAARQDFGGGFLLRPLLDVPRAELEAYATQQGLRWVEDPSNTDNRFDRNYLRNEIIPRLQTRWPAATASLARSAELAREANELLNALADIDLAVHRAPARLSVPALLDLSEDRQRNLLRRAVSRCALPAAPATRLRQVVNELLPAKTDAQPLVSWRGVEVRRYRDTLYILPAVPPGELGTGQQLIPDGEGITLGAGLGTLRFVAKGTRGIAPEIAAPGLSVRYRHGGEEIRPAGHKVTRKLKKLLQEEGVLPWMRDRLPLLYAGERLVAVADLWVADECTAENGLTIDWQDRPPLR